MDNDFELLRDLETGMKRYVDALEKRVVFNEAEVERISAQLRANLNRARKQIHFKMTQLITRVIQVKETLAALEKNEKNR